MVKDMLFLTESDVTDWLSPQEAYMAVEVALTEYGRGQVDNQPRYRARLGEVTLNTMSAAVPSLGWLGAKIYTTGPKGPQALFTLFAEDGTPKCIMEADELGRIRTAAVSALATRKLARLNASVMALLGTGFQAEAQLLAIASAMSLQEVRVWNRNLKKATDFCEKLQEQTGARLRPTDDIPTSVRNADIITTTTAAADPVLYGKWLEPGVHVNAIGNNRAYEREIDAEVVRRSNIIYVDAIPQARIESGDLILAEQDGVEIWSRVHELSDLLVKRGQSRSDDREITLFKSIGLALEDVAVADVVYRKALVHSPMRIKYSSGTPLSIL